MKQDDCGCRSFHRDGNLKTCHPHNQQAWTVKTRILRLRLRLRFRLRFRSRWGLKLGFIFRLRWRLLLWLWFYFWHVYSRLLTRVSWPISGNTFITADWHCFQKRPPSLSSTSHCADVRRKHSSIHALHEQWSVIHETNDRPWGRRVATAPKLPVRRRVKDWKNINRFEGVFIPKHKHSP